MNYAIIFDLEGTLADHSQRQHHLTGDDSGWDAYWQDLGQDEPLAAGATIYNLLVTQCLQLGRMIHAGKAEADYPFVDILTGRPERYRPQTIEWMTTHGLLMPRKIHMRPDTDHRPDTIFKIDLYERVYKDKEMVLCVFEDRERVVKAWREAGVACFQVADGKF
jgi:hypothetical protein